MAFELFVARRIYSDRTEGLRFSRPAVRIAVAGISIGLIVMLISVGVVMGFKREVSSKVVGFGAHAQIISMTMDDSHQLFPVITDDTLMNIVMETPGVEHVQPFVFVQGMLKTDEDFRGVQIKGVGEDYDMSFFQQYLIAGEIPSFSSQESSNQLLISNRIAKELNLHAGEKVFAYFVGGDNIRARRFTIAGIYETHLAEYDRITCLTDIRTARRLNKWNDDQTSGLEIRVSDFSQVDDVVSRLVPQVNHTPDRIGAMRAAFTIREIAPHIFSWLEVLDMNVVMILILMMAIGGFTVVSGLLIVMLERIQMIGLLKALGATNGQVRRIFRHFAVMLVGQAVLIGDAVGLLLCFVQQRWSLVKLDAENYYIDHVPVEFDWSAFLAINIGVLLISSLVIFGSSYLMSIKGPSSTMRWE